MLRNMQSKVQDRAKAIVMRKKGKSYREIMAVVPVSKGTLSKWLKDLPLTKREARFLQERSKLLQDNGRLKTAKINRDRSEKRHKLLRVKARADFEKYKDDPFFVLGLSLYWSQGSKNDDYISFTSSDVAMIKLMMAWTSKYLPVEPLDYKFRLYLYKSYINEKCEKFWSRTCAIPASQFQKTIYKQSAKLIKGNEYQGSLRMIVPGIENLLTVKTWQNCLSEYYVEA